MLRVLVVTYLPWNNSISVGNTLSNIFDGMQDRLEFANIYFRDDIPQNKLCKRYFHISEREMITSCFTRKKVGKEFTSYNEGKSDLSERYNQARRIRWEVMLLVQDLIGFFANWKSKALDEFVEAFAPDIIFGPLGRMPVSNEVMRYLSSKYKIPLITYPWDDHYSLKKLSLNPFFWIKTFLERYSIQRCARQSDMLYTITSMMQKEYHKYFGKPCKVLYKGYDFVKYPINIPVVLPIKIIYMGNIGSGRWKVLAKVAKAINEIGNGYFELYVYSLSPKSKRMVEVLNYGNSHLMDAVKAEDVLSTMQSADILLHVEPTSVKEQLNFRLSFSTKLVDYFYNGKCILAIGGKSGSIKYLQENNSAIIENNVSRIKNILSKLISNTTLIEEYAKKSWECGVRNHQIKKIQADLYEDLYKIIERKKHANK